MTNEIQSCEAAAKIERGINRIKKDVPSLESVVNAFREVFLGRAILKARLSGVKDICLSPPDPFRFSKGAPLFTEDIIICLIDPWEDSIDLTIPIMEKVFPNIKPDLVCFKAALDRGDVDLRYCIGALVRDQEEKIEEIASCLPMQPLILRFILVQMLKPFVEKMSEDLKPLIANLPWHKGYCPICGSFPELSFLRGDEGQRWLRCSLCGHEWRFKRIVCPFCENEDHTKMELNFIEGRDHEWAEICHTCQKYIVNIDLRKCAEDVTTEVAALGMMYLDILEQGKGLSPVAHCAWNMVVTND